MSYQIPKDRDCNAKFKQMYNFLSNKSAPQNVKEKKEKNNLLRFAF